MDESSLRDPSQARKRQIATAIFVLFSSISRQLCGSYKAVYSSVLQNSHWFMSTDFIAQHYSKTLDSKITHSELRNKKKLQFGTLAKLPSSQDCMELAGLAKLFSKVEHEEFVGWRNF